MKRRLTNVGIALACGALCAAAFMTSASGQQPGQQPPPAKQPELPPGHPPIQPGQRPQPGSPSKGPIDRARLQEMLNRQKQGKQGQPGLPGTPPPPAAPAEAPKPQFPRDAHGHCLGDGADDRPKDINLFHGWFGVDNEAAPTAPNKSGGEEWWGKEWLGNKEWWAWRLTPYPYRYENHDDHCDPRNQPVPLLANVINIGILLFLFVRFGRKPIRAALSDRKKSIMSEIDKAREIRDNAQARLDEYTEDLKHLDERLAGLRAQYAAEGENEKKRVLADMIEKRERMMTDAAFRVSQEESTARESLSREALASALAAAEALIQKSLGPEDHDRLAEAYLDEIGPALKRAEGVRKA